MTDCRYEVVRDGFELSFKAAEREVPALRRFVQRCLEEWGVPEAIEAAQHCASELVANVIAHVGALTPTVFGLALNGTCVRMEVGDPDTQGLPRKLAPSNADAEHGRGMAIVDALSDRWGVLVREDSKVTWCEIGTELISPAGHAGGRRVDRAEELIGEYVGDVATVGTERSRLAVAAAEEKVIGVIAGLLHWGRVHGCDPDRVLNSAQSHFEAEASQVDPVVLLRPE